MSHLIRHDDDVPNSVTAATIAYCGGVGKEDRTNKKVEGRVVERVA